MILLGFFRSWALNSAAHLRFLAKHISKPPLTAKILAGCFLFNIILETFPIFCKYFITKILQLQSLIPILSTVC